MDLFEWLSNNGTVLDGAVIIRFVILGFIIEFFGIVSYWTRRF